VLFVELCIATLGSGLALIDSNGAELEAGFGSPAQIGELLLTKFLLPFEVASFLLLIAAVGAVVLARRRGGISAAEDQARYSAMDMLRPAYTGTMAEAVGHRGVGAPLIVPVPAEESDVAQPQPDPDA
jgi:NADH-quinone oxidoreductase subunit J